VFENVAFPLRLRKLSRSEVEAKTLEALRHTSLSQAAGTYPGDLSGGEKQRIALARALAVNPDVMLLDEPLSNLDPHLREEMRFEIKDLQRKFGFSIIYVTHDQSEAMALSDRVMVMRDGAVQQVGSPLDVYSRPANQFVFSFIGLSNFIPAELAGGAAFPEGDRQAGPLAADIPAEFAGRDAAILACRPTDVDFAADGSGVRGLVKRRVYLGEVVDYRVQVGATEIRIQKNRRHRLAAEGEAVGLLFRKLLWYDRES
jgi:iron(III) transport system ATP-binding protein